MIRLLSGPSPTCLLIPSLQSQTKKLTAAEAKDHLGDRATVCGKVVALCKEFQGRANP
jgi:hypothetical protein